MAVSLESLHSLESLENGFSEKTPFPKDPFFRTRLVHVSCLLTHTHTRLGFNEIQSRRSQKEAQLATSLLAPTPLRMGASHRTRSACGRGSGQRWLWTEQRQLGGSHAGKAAERRGHQGHAVDQQSGRVSGRAAWRSGQERGQWHSWSRGWRESHWAVCSWGRRGIERTWPWQWLAGEHVEGPAHQGMQSPWHPRQCPLLAAQWPQDLLACDLWLWAPTAQLAPSNPLVWRVPPRCLLFGYGGPCEAQKHMSGHVGCRCQAGWDRGVLCWQECRSSAVQQGKQAVRNGRRPLSGKARQIACIWVPGCTRRWGSCSGDGQG